MNQWTKKPVTITAVQYNGNTGDLPYEMGVDITRSVEGGSCFIHTLEGEMECRVGDYIIRGVKGEFYPCKPDIFEMTYMPAIGGSGDKEVEDVRAFQLKFDILSNDKPTMLTKRKLQERIECMQEELDEFKKAVEAQDFAEQADALIDLVYFAKGTAVMMGLPWAALWDDVQRANMSKVRGVGKRGHMVDMVKPEGWKKPDGETILKNAGYQRADFTDNAGNVIEDLCADDAFRKMVQRLTPESVAQDILSVQPISQEAGDALKKIIDLGFQNELIDKVAYLLCKANNAKRGPDMKGPTMQLDDGRCVLAYTRKGTYSEDLNDFKDAGVEGKTIHMYQVELVDFPARPTIDPTTFEPTGELTPAEKFLLMRFGVS